MAPVRKNTITHLTHPEHSLKLDESAGYTCDGCEIHGTGKRYHCNNGCDFDLHVYCGTCPMTFFSFMHPNHQLELVVPGPQAKGQLERICNVCGHTVKGMFYRCEPCEFDVHPLCTQYPDTLCHVLHQVHPLKLTESSEPGICAVCGEECNTSSWRYRCAPCGIDIHLGCENKKFQFQTYVPPPPNWNGNAYGSPYNMQHVPWSPQHYPNQPQQDVPNRRRGGGGLLGRAAIAFGVGAISNIIFGADILSPIIDMI